MSSSKEIEKITNGKDLLAIVIRRNFHKEGISFLTDPEENIQFGYFSHSKGQKIQPHVHKEFIRNTSGTQEVLFIKDGSLKVNFFSKNQKSIGKNIILSKGDWIVLLSEGHGFEMLSDCKIIEVKNGPYAGDEDKVRFNEEL